MRVVKCNVVECICRVKGEVVLIDIGGGCEENVIFVVYYYKIICVGSYFVIVVYIWEVVNGGLCL